MVSRTLLTEQQAAELLTIKVKTLQKWRVCGGGPKFIKLGRAVRYDPDSLLEFVRERTVASTAEEEARRGTDL
jgi:predicted DNA-binding transcriptional regulator AlpA